VAGQLDWPFGSAFARGWMFAMTEHVTVIKRWVDGSDVLTWFERRRSRVGPIPVVSRDHGE
jgi:hypothetical protein